MLSVCSVGVVVGELGLGDWRRCGESKNQDTERYLLKGRSRRKMQSEKLKARVRCTDRPPSGGARREVVLE